MEERRDLIAFNRMMEEKKHQIQKRVNMFNPTIIGGLWKPESLMSYLRDVNNTDLGKWGENLFEDEFGYVSMEGPLDIPELNVDIKVVKRAEFSTAFNMHYTAQMKAAKAGLIKDINKVIYVVYLVFPDYYELIYIPHSHIINIRYLFCFSKSITTFLILIVLLHSYTLYPKVGRIQYLLYIRIHQLNFQPLF